MTTFDGADPVQFDLRPEDDLNAARGVVLGVLIGIAGWGLVMVAILAVVRGHLWCRNSPYCLWTSWSSAA
jgi:hypothetical protein